MEIRELRKGKTIKMLVFGVPGAGKTRLAGTGENTLIIRPPTDHTDSIVDGDTVRECVVEDWADMYEIFRLLQQGDGTEFDWVWLDSLSLFQDFGMDSVMLDAMTRRPDRADAALSTPDDPVPTYGPDQGEYKINFDRIAKWCREMIGVAETGAFNFGITAHPFEWYDPVKEETVWAPWIQGKGMSPKISGYMNVVAYLDVVRIEPDDEDGEVEERRVLLTDAPGFYGKNQLGKFPRLSNGSVGLVEPTIPKVVEALRGGSSSPARKKKTTTKKATKRPARRRRS